MIKSNDEQGLSDYLNWINIDNKFRDSIPVNITEKQDIPFGKISGFEIAKQIANVRHILFEVTDSCSLRCTYCGYGEFYEDHDQRLNTNLPTESAKLFLDYMISRFRTTDNSSINYNVFVSFYGGEPLLNISFIRGIISFIETYKVPNINFLYNITTNAVLLHRNLDQLQALTSITKVHR